MRNKNQEKNQQKNKEIAQYITDRCNESKLSYRSLSVKAGLSISTVHNIVSGKSRPNVFSLNSLADYLGVKREFLWRLAGLMEAEEMQSDGVKDPRLQLYITQIDKMPSQKKEAVIRIIETLITNISGMDVKKKESG